jgi:hypothetical protein
MTINIIPIIFLFLTGANRAYLYELKTNKLMTHDVYCL